VPSQRLDVIIWDNPIDKEVTLSPVSPKGLEWARQITGDPATSTISIAGNPAAFAQDIPPTLGVFFHKDDGNLVKMSSGRDLQ